MGAREFGLRVDQQMRERQIGASKLAARVGELPDGRVLDATGVRLIRQGRREKYDTELVRRIALAVGLDEDEAYWTAGVWPAPLDLESYRRYRQLVTTIPKAVSPGTVALPVSSELDQLIRRNRRRGDRRHLHLVKPVAA